jgi:glycosyltransferase involved in cell wall biosynthesis
VSIRVLVLAPFFREGDPWIDDFCGRPDLRFRKAPYPNPDLSWHRWSGATPYSEWLNYFAYARRALEWPSDCVVTSFPQLALVTAALLRGSRRSPRLVAWNFNIGSLKSPWKGRVAGRVLSRVDRFIVHARGEIDSYAKWLGLDRARFQFLPLQRGAVQDVPPSPVSAPYVLSMGSANRDYATLVEAVSGLSVPTVIVSKKAIIETLPDVAGLTKLHGLSRQACDAMLAGATLNVVPTRTMGTASGQVTFTTAMRLGVPTIATRDIGSVDYIEHGKTGLLIPPADVAALREAIRFLWNDAPLRARMSAAARDVAQECFSDEAAGRNLARVIDEVVRT